MERAGLTSRGYGGRAIAAPLQFRVSSARLEDILVLASVYPTLTRARLGDSLDVVRSARMAILASRDALLDVIGDRVRTAIAALPDPVTSGAPDQRWYWAAPFLLDDLAQLGGNTQLIEWMGGRTADDADDTGRRGLGEHARQAQSISADQLVPTAGGVCARWALARVVDGQLQLEELGLRAAAYDIAQGLATLFNKPETVVLLRSDESTYWRAVLDRCVDGCLQSVLDEYTDTLVESAGLQTASADERVLTISGSWSKWYRREPQPMCGAGHGQRGQTQLDAHRICSHFAARFGRTQADYQAAQREETVRAAFNSPFRPFVLASTSVGQGGAWTSTPTATRWCTGTCPACKPLDLEQREGCVHRYKWHAVRRGVAAQFVSAAVESDCADPWAAVFAAPQAARSDGDSDIKPF